jgi:hypothetical protein
MVFFKYCHFWKENTLFIIYIYYNKTKKNKKKKHIKDFIGKCLVKMKNNMQNILFRGC